MIHGLATRIWYRGLYRFLRFLTRNSGTESDIKRGKCFQCAGQFVSGGRTKTEAKMVLTGGAERRSRHEDNARLLENSLGHFQTAKLTLVGHK